MLCHELDCVICVITAAEGGRVVARWASEHKLQQIYECHNILRHKAFP